MGSSKISIDTSGMGWDEIRKLISLRDHGKCCECGRVDTHRNRTHVHHKDRDKANNHPNNLITLCAYCHGRMHSDIKFDKEKHMLFIKRLVQIKGISISGELAPAIGISQPAVTAYLNSVPSGLKRLLQFKEFINERLGTEYTIEELFSIVEA